MADNTDTVLDEDISAIENLDLTDPNVQLGGPSANTDDTAATKGTDEAAATTDDKTATTTTEDKTDESDAKDGTEAKAQGDKQSQASDEASTQDKDTQQQQPSEEEQRQAAAIAFQERQRNRSRDQDQIAQQLDQGFGPKSEQQFIEEGNTPEHAAFLAYKANTEYAQERARISTLNADMRAEANDITRDFPIFRELNPDGTKNPDYDPDLSARAQESYKQAARLQTTVVGQRPDGSPIEVVTNADVSLYDHYKMMHDVYNRGTSKGEQIRQSQVQDMMSRTENPGGSSATNGPTAGSLEEMEARLGDVRIA